MAAAYNRLNEPKEAEEARAKVARGVPRLANPATASSWPRSMLRAAMRKATT